MSQGQGNGPPDHVEERHPDHVHVGKPDRDKNKEQANCDDQQDRIEAKLDLLLDELDAEY